MPDEFPTLEAALLIGTLVALARTWALGSGLRQTPHFARALEVALSSRDLARARALGERSRAVTAAHFGHVLVEGLDGTLGAAGANRSLERAFARTRTRVRRGLARDLAVLAVLFGAGAYAARAPLDVGSLFYGLLGLALALTVFGAILRQRTLQALVVASRPLGEAARAAVAAPKEGP
jgi:hypothetical protein